MKLLANENIPLASIKRLKSKGFDISAIGVDNPSITDEEVIKLAIDEERTIITYDSDYGELIFKYGHRPKGGVIFIRSQPNAPLETAIILEKILNKSDLEFQNRLTVVDSKSIRQKKYASK